MQKPWLWTAVVCCLVIPPTASAAGKPSLCFVTEWCGGEQEDVPLVEELRKQGFHVDNVGFQHLGVEKMAEYNALIFPEFPMSDSFITRDSNWRVRPQALEPFYKAIEAYVQGGGGVVVYGVCFFQTHENGRRNMNVMLKPWGAETLFEQVIDPDREYLYRQQYGYDYSWTANLVEHPLTEGLGLVFYTRSYQHGATTCTFNLSKDWAVLVRGEPSSFSVGVAGHEFETGVKRTHESEPPIIAVREYGKGRLALVGVTPVMAVFGARFVGYGNVLMEAGSGVTKSDYGQLQERLYRWAAEPAFQAGKPGGFAGRPVELTVHKDLVLPKVDWQNFDPGNTDMKPYRGLIGARTGLTGGEGSVTEYAEAVKKTGLDFIAFAEDFARLTPATWEQFKKDCRAASTDTFLAMPGFVFRDNVDARWIALGEFDYPPKRNFDETGKKIIQPNWWIDCRYPMIGPIEPVRGPRPFWEIGLYSAMAVETYEEGKRIDAALDAFQDRSEAEHLIAPLIVDLIRSPDEVTRAARHITGCLAPGLDDLRRDLNRSMVGKPNFFASTGPVLTDWRQWNSPRSTHGRRGEFPGTELAVVHFKLTSDKGLEEVCLMDGPHIFRRYLPGGQKSISKTVYFPHDRQRHMLLVAADVEGGRLVTGQRVTHDFLNWRFMCGDNGNTICDAVLRTPEGRVYITGPVAPYQRTTTMFGFTPGISELPARFAAPYVDGGVRMIPHDGVPAVYLKGVSDREGKFLSRMVHPLSSRDVVIQESDLRAWTDNPQVDAWRPSYPVQELTNYTASVRWIDFAKRDHDPGFTLVEGRITFLRDVELDPARTLNPRIDLMWASSSDHACPGFSFEGVEGIKGAGLAGVSQRDRPVQYTGPLHRGGFAAFLPYYSGSGAVLPLDEGMLISAHLVRPRLTVSTGLSLGGKTFKRGDELRYRLLVGRGVIGAEPTDREWREFVDLMGLDGEPGYSLEMLQGDVVEKNFVLAAEASGGGVAFRIGAANLPMLLPITVQGLSPKITTGLFNSVDRSCLPVGVIETEGKAYLTWDTSRGEAQLYIGNLLLCDHEGLIITVTTPADEWQIEVHNPTDRTIEAAVRGPSQIESLAAFGRQVNLPPGDSVILAVPRK